MEMEGVKTVAQVTFCDLCHKPIKFENTTRKFKIKEVKHFINHFDCMAWDSWVTIDAHSECVEKLFEATKDGEQK